MKCLLTKLCSLLLFMPCVAFAGWQLAQPVSSVPREPFFQEDARMSTNASCQVPTTRMTGGGGAVYAISVSGSLKENIERIMQRYHWKVKWKAPYDYNFDGRVTGANLPDVMKKLISPFPLQAVLYMANRTMVVVPRTI